MGALPDEAKQVAILVTGARYKATFEIYAHVHVALEKRLASAKLATIVAGQRPVDLTPSEGIAITSFPRSARAACCRAPPTIGRAMPSVGAVLPSLSISSGCTPWCARP